MKKGQASSTKRQNDVFNQGLAFHSFTECFTNEYSLYVTIQQQG